MKKLFNAILILLFIALWIYVGYRFGYRDGHIFGYNQGYGDGEYHMMYKIKDDLAKQNIFIDIKKQKEE